MTITIQLKGSDDRAKSLSFLLLIKAKIWKGVQFFSGKFSTILSRDFESDKDSGLDHYFAELGQELGWVSTNVLVFLPVNSNILS